MQQDKQSRPRAKPVSRARRALVSASKFRLNLGERSSEEARAGEGQARVRDEERASGQSQVRRRKQRVVVARLRMPGTFNKEEHLVLVLRGEASRTSEARSTGGLVGVRGRAHHHLEELLV